MQVQTVVEFTEREIKDLIVAKAREITKELNPGEAMTVELLDRDALDRGGQDLPIARVLINRHVKG